ncbi:hypothetical protein RQP46_000040 [Phenoliferia psychrophenolica]
MATFSHLPAELLLHIFHLSTEHDTVQWRQRCRFQFGLVARAFFLATAAPNDFHVASEKQAKALVAAMERERKWVANEERKARSGRTTRVSLSVARFSNIRRLSLVIKDAKSEESFANLLRVNPKLIALDIDVFLATKEHPIQVEGGWMLLEAALGGLSTLHEFRHRSYNYDAAAILRLVNHICGVRSMDADGSPRRILIPLKSLEILDLAARYYYDNQGETVDPLLRDLILPNLRELRMDHESWPEALQNRLFSALATGSKTGILDLDLASTEYQSLRSDSPVFKSLIPHTGNVVHLTWTPPPWIMDMPSDAVAQDTVLAIIAAMPNLQSIKISTWTMEEDIDSYNPEDDKFFVPDRPIDPKLFDTLATLPSLHSVILVVEEMTLLDEKVVISFIEAHHPLRSLYIVMRSPYEWSEEQWVAVEEVAEQAGVAFSRFAWGY